MVTEVRSFPCLRRFSSSFDRRLIINEGLIIGSQIEYIRRAEAAGYAVIVTNTNYNRTEDARSLRSRLFSSIRVIRFGFLRFIRTDRVQQGSETPESHGQYVWEHFIRPNPAKHVAVMAHSYGGAVVLAIAEKFYEEFDQRVFAVALTDSPMTFYGDRVKKKVLKMLKEVSGREVPVETGRNTFPCRSIFSERSIGSSIRRKSIRSWAKRIVVSCVLPVIARSSPSLRSFDFFFFRSHGP